MARPTLLEKLFLVISFRIEALVNPACSPITVTPSRAFESKTFWVTRLSFPKSRRPAPSPPPPPLPRTVLSRITKLPSARNVSTPPPILPSMWLPMIRTSLENAASIPSCPPFPNAEARISFPSINQLVAFSSLIPENSDPVTALLSICPTTLSTTWIPWCPAPPEAFARSVDDIASPPPTTVFSIRIFVEPKIPMLAPLPLTSPKPRTVRFSMDVLSPPSTFNPYSKLVTAETIESSDPSTPLKTTSSPVPSTPSIPVPTVNTSSAVPSTPSAPGRAVPVSPPTMAVFVFRAETPSRKSYAVPSMRVPSSVISGSNSET